MIAPGKNDGSKRPRLDAIGEGAAFQGVPLRECLDQPAAELAARADEVATLCAQLGEPRLGDAERGTLPGQGYDQQALLAEGNAAALEGSAKVAERAGVTAPVLEAARAAQGELLRAQAGAAQLLADAEDGERFLQAAQGHGCKLVLAWLEQELRTASPAEQQKLHGLAAPLLTLWERIQAQRAQEAAKEERRLRSARAQLEEAQAGARARGTLGKIERGEVPAPDEIEEAAAQLTPETPGRTDGPRRTRR